jgi:hypothetical protein
MIMRSLYRFLVWLHPLEFREKFGEEMLCIFDEAAGGPGSASLVADAASSMARQWLSRAQLWKWALATLGGMVSLFCGFGGFLTWRGIWEAVRAAF